MPNRVPPQVIHDRENRLKGRADELALSYKRLFVGETVFPLVEHRRDRRTGQLAGWSARYVRTLCDGPDEFLGRIAPVRIADVTAEFALGEIAA